VNGASRIAAIIELLRPPNVFTALADSLAGLALARGTAFSLADPGLFCLPASACLYLGGMALNDYFDREIDARERPERPIPSGRLPAAWAASLGAGLIAAGLALAFAAGIEPFAAAAALAAAILLYDAGAKGVEAGSLVMGLCRGLNFLMPLTLAEDPSPFGLLTPPLLLAAYVAAFTYLARHEVGGNEPERVRQGLLALGAVAAALVVTLAYAPSHVAGWAVLVVVIVRGVSIFAPLVRDSSGPATGRAIGDAILLIPLFDAVFVAAAGLPGLAAAVAALALPAIWLRRLYSPT